MPTDEEIDAAMDVISKALKDGLGERCEIFDLGCLGCAAWRSYDELSNALYQIWDVRQKTS